jgi:hypothetical protein
MQRIRAIGPVLDSNFILKKRGVGSFSSAELKNRQEI